MVKPPPMPAPCVRVRTGTTRSGQTSPAGPQLMRTRWGSCSRIGGIRLNWRLIHLPSTQIDYVVAHEMAHLLEMNHSDRFWAVVERLCPDYESIRTALNLSSRLIPAW